MFLKFRCRPGFESLCAEVSDSITWQRFCRIPLGRAPHPTTLMKLTTRCGSQRSSGAMRPCWPRRPGEPAADVAAAGRDDGRRTCPTRPIRGCWRRRSAGWAWAAGSPCIAVTMRGPRGHANRCGHRRRSAYPSLAARPTSSRLVAAEIALTELRRVVQEVRRAFAVGGSERVGHRFLGSPLPCHYDRRRRRDEGDGGVGADRCGQVERLAVSAGSTRAIRAELKILITVSPPKYPQPSGNCNGRPLGPGIRAIRTLRRPAQFLHWRAGSEGLPVLAWCRSGSQRGGTS